MAPAGSSHLDVLLSLLPTCERGGEGERRTIEDEGEGAAAAEVDDLAGWGGEEGRVDFERGGDLVDLARVEGLAVLLHAGRRR